MGPEVHDHMFRSGCQSDTNPSSVKFPSKLYTHFIDPLKRWKAESTLPSPGFEPWICSVEARPTNHLATGLHIKQKHVQNAAYHCLMSSGMGNPMFNRWKQCMQ
ncbi:hypothetical protein TNCV_3883981 [Trichonephila clavipes]|nr:hypothetical protein TNCV_3883981 [Trichonephila clavipes]